MIIKEIAIAGPKGSKHKEDSSLSEFFFMSLNISLMHHKIPQIINKRNIREEYMLSERLNLVKIYVINIKNKETLSAIQVSFLPVLYEWIKR